MNGFNIDAVDDLVISNSMLFLSVGGPDIFLLVAPSVIQAAFHLGIEFGVREPELAAKVSAPFLDETVPELVQDLVEVGLGG